MSTLDSTAPTTENASSQNIQQVLLPQFSIKQLIDAGFHFGHKTMRRNPKMSKYIYTSRNGISIIDLNKTAQLLHNGLKTVKEIAKNNGRILFIATKKQAVEAVAESAIRCGQYYVNSRWLGGMLTNYKTISQSIRTLKKVEDQLKDTEIGFNKKEKLTLDRQRIKLEQNLGGIKNMGGYPDLVVVIDINKESLAIAEAKKLNIPIMALIDTNCNPDKIYYPIPGNDDSAKSIKLFCRLISDAIIAGTKENMLASGLDINKIAEKSFLENLSEVKKNNEKPSKTFDTKRKFVKTEGGKFENTNSAGKDADKKPSKPNNRNSAPKKPDNKSSAPKKPDSFTPKFTDKKPTKPKTENK
jgi:small subunit ribosomal protein S2